MPWIRRDDLRFHRRGSPTGWGLDGHENNAASLQALLELFPLGALPLEGTRQILRPDNELLTDLLNAELQVTRSQRTQLNQPNSARFLGFLKD